MLRKAKVLSQKIGENESDLRSRLDLVQPE